MIWSEPFLLCQTIFSVPSRKTGNACLTKQNHCEKPTISTKISAIFAYMLDCIGKNECRVYQRICMRILLIGLQIYFVEYIMSLHFPHNFHSSVEVTMRGDNTTKKTAISDEPKIKRKPGRQPMTAEEKEAAARIRAAEKEKADNLRPELILQYQDCDVDMSVLVEAAKSDFHKTKKRTLVTGLKLYIKPEDHMAYYVINDTYEGKIPF